MSAFLRLCMLTSLVASFTMVGADSSHHCRPSKSTYEIYDSYIALVMGCYHSPGMNAVFPGSSYSNLWPYVDIGRWAREGSAGDVIRLCGLQAIETGANYFGIKAHGECFHGNRPDVSRGEITDADGCSSHCQFDVGGPGAMVVFKIEDSSSWFEDTPVAVL